MTRYAGSNVGMEATAPPHLTGRMIATWLTAGSLRTTRWASAIVFAIFGTGKFVDHSTELASFRLYGLPAPNAFVYFIGALELAGALALALNKLTRLAAIALAGDMLGAITLSGIGRGEILSLTLAPVLLVAMLYVIATGTWCRCGSLPPGATQTTKARIR